MMCLFASCVEDDIYEEIFIYEDICGVVQYHDIYIDNLGYNTYILVIRGQRRPVNYETFYNTFDGEEICLDY